MDPSRLIEQHQPTRERQVFSGYVSLRKPVPTSSTGALFVILPDYSGDVPVGPCQWGPANGSALPAAGAAVTVVFDDVNVPTVVWWATSLPPTVKVALPYAANWGNYGSGWAPGQYWRDADGTVHLQGLVHKSTAVAVPDTIATLPAGFRPVSTQHMFIAATGDAYTAGQVNILADGSVQVGAGSFTGTNYVSLSGISFR